MERRLLPPFPPKACACNQQPVGTVGGEPRAHHLPWALNTCCSLQPSRPRRCNAGPCLPSPDPWPASHQPRRSLCCPGSPPRRLSTATLPLYSTSLLLMTQLIAHVANTSLPPQLPPPTPHPPGIEAMMRAASDAAERRYKKKAQFILVVLPDKVCKGGYPQRGKWEGCKGGRV